MRVPKYRQLDAPAGAALLLQECIDYATARDHVEIA